MSKNWRKARRTQQIAAPGEAATSARVGPPTPASAPPAAVSPPGAVSEGTESASAPASANGQSLAAAVGAQNGKAGLGGGAVLLVERWLWRAFAVGPWFWFFCAIVQRATGYVLPCSGWVGLSFLVPMVFFCLAGKPARAAGYFGYIVFFPITMGVKTTWHFPRRAGQVWRAFVVVTSLWAAVAVLAPIIALTAVLVLVRDAATLLVLVPMQLVLVTWFLVCIVRWGADPLRPAHTFLTIVTYVTNVLEKSTPNETPEETERQKPGRLKTLGYFEQGFEWAIQKIDYMIQRTIVPVFSIVLVTVFLVTVVAYASIFYALQNLPESSFENLGQSFVKCCAYSVSVITTNSIGNVAPKSELACVAYACELFGTFLLISVFFSMFSASMSVHAESRMQELEQIKARVRDWIRSKRSNLSTATIEGQVVRSREIPPLASA